MVLQLGALPTDKGLTNSTALESTGWVELLKGLTGYGQIRVTAGSLTDFDEPNLFERDHDLNYFEISMSRKVLGDMLVELGYESFEGDDFIFLAAKKDLDLAARGIVTLVAESLINVNSETHKSSVGVKGDLIRLLTGVETGLNLELRTTYAGDNIGDRGTTLNSGFKSSEGHYGTISTQFKISKSHDVDGYMRYRRNYDDDVDDERFEIGITKKYK